MVGNRGPARSGATSAWIGEFRVRKGAPGCSWELSGGRFWELSEPRKSIFGALRASVAPKVDLWSPLSVRCFPKFIHGQRKERLQPGLGIHSDLGISRLKWYRRSSFLVNE